MSKFFDLLDEAHLSGARSRSTPASEAAPGPDDDIVKIVEKERINTETGHKDITVTRVPQPRPSLASPDPGSKDGEESMLQIIAEGIKRMGDIQQETARAHGAPYAAEREDEYEEDEDDDE